MKPERGLYNFFPFFPTEKKKKTHQEESTKSRGSLANSHCHGVSTCLISLPCGWAGNNYMRKNVFSLYDNYE